MSNIKLQRISANHEVSRSRSNATLSCTKACMCSASAGSATACSRAPPVPVLDNPAAVAYRNSMMTEKVKGTRSADRPDQTSVCDGDGCRVGGPDPGPGGGGAGIKDLLISADGRRIWHLARRVLKGLPFREGLQRYRLSGKILEILSGMALIVVEAGAHLSHGWSPNSSAVQARRLSSPNVRVSAVSAPRR